VGGTCSMHGRDKRIHSFSWKPVGKRQFGRLGRRWNDIKMHLKEMTWQDVNSILMDYDRDT
jgi:hypothetical protein